MRSPPQSERGEMKLFLADYYLEAARLSLAEGKKDQAREYLATAREMIEAALSRFTSGLRRDKSPRQVDE